jgi:formate dehydrogenase assembly factor FdhD
MTDLSCSPLLPEPLDPATQPASRPVPVLRVDGPDVRPCLDEVVEEVPVALVFNGISHAVLLATPTDLEDLALGFSLSEGILESRSELYDLECASTANGIELRLEIASSRFAALKARRRTLAGRTGCGLCGVESLDALARPVAPVAAFPHPHHRGHRRPGGTAGLAAPAQAHRGRACRRLDQPRRPHPRPARGMWGATTPSTSFSATWRAPEPSGGFVLVSSRASYEMVQKVAMLGIGCLVAVSAPTALAVRLTTDAASPWPASPVERGWWSTATRWGWGWRPT